MCMIFPQGGFEPPQADPENKNSGELDTILYYIDINLKKSQVLFLFLAYFNPLKIILTYSVCASLCASLSLH